MAEQKFHKGDLIRFTRRGQQSYEYNDLAYIIGSFADQFHNKSNTYDFSVYRLGSSSKWQYGHLSWVRDTDMAIVKKRTLASITKLEKLIREEGC